MVPSVTDEAGAAAAPGERQLPHAHRLDDLADGELLRREARLGGEFRRLELLHPSRRDTTFRVLAGSAGLLQAWTRWREVRVLIDARGLEPLEPATSPPNDDPTLEGAW